ncbi:TLR adapter interacting with SLC15A4 on the lysosome-like [Eudromia elegans]
MLAEGVLTGLLYKETSARDKSHKCHATKKVKEGIWREELVDKPQIKEFAAGRELQDKNTAKSSRMEHKRNPRWKSREDLAAEDREILVRGTTSPPLHIPTREQNNEHLDLYRSWSCNSIYQNYPDLHIGGDHVGDHMCDSGCVLDHVCDELPDGPVLFSADIPLGQSPPSQHLEKTGIKSLPGEETGERSMVLCEEPLSNSVLNNYVERKVAELYKQFFEESLARCGSITNLLTCSFIRNNLNQISFQISQEQNIETSKAREVLLHSLALLSVRNATNGNSSEFSTPNLQISNAACVEKSHSSHHD